jgi:hypothetical protein
LLHTHVSDAVAVVSIPTFAEFFSARLRTGVKEGNYLLDHLSSG